ncbi:MAG: SpoIIE family protein phosphatase [Chloroflexota bacterium]
MRQIERVLSQVPLFKSLPESEYTHLADSLRPVSLQDGEFLFCEGDCGAHFYIIIEGGMQIIKALGTHEETVLGVREPGEFIGEMSLINPDGLRTATVRAVGATRLLEMYQEEFEALLIRRPKLAWQMVRVLSARMTASQDNAIRYLQTKNEELQQAYDDLKAAQAQLIEKERLERELQVAHQIQMSILPHKLPHLEGFDFGALMMPARAVGGDFYGMFPLGKDKVGVAVGDVTDKGVPAALFMAQTHALLRAEAHRGQSPAQTLRRVNHLLLEMSANSLFVTVLYGVLERQTRKFTYARAGHELPLVRSASGEIHLAPLGDGMPLGIFDDPDLDEYSFTLEEGSTILLYSDGATDIMDPQGRNFGMSRLQAVLAETDGLDGQNVCQQIFQELSAFQGDAAQFDDITLVAVKG